MYCSMCIMKLSETSKARLRPLKTRTDCFFSEQFYAHSTLCNILIVFFSKISEDTNKLLENTVTVSVTVVYKYLYFPI